MVKHTDNSAQWRPSATQTITYYSAGVIFKQNTHFKNFETKKTHMKQNENVQLGFAETTS